LEKPNPEDGRSVLVALSAKGKKLLENCFMQLSGNEDLLEVLSEEEQMNFLSMLEKLDHCHSEKAGILSIPEWMEEAYQYMF
jgi:DNA-binding MarR family transcriptional regulator